MKTILKLRELEKQYIYECVCVYILNVYVCVCDIMLQMMWVIPPFTVA